MSVSWVSVSARTGADLIELPDLDVASVSDVLAEYQTTTFTMPVVDPPRGWRDALSEGSRFLVLLDDGVPMWGGLVLRTEDATDTVSGTIVTIPGYLDRRFIGDARYTQVGQHRIVEDLLLRFVADGPVPGIALRVVVHGGDGTPRDRSYADSDDRTVLSGLQELWAVEGGAEWVVRFEWVADMLVPTVHVGTFGVDTLAELTLPGVITSVARSHSYASGDGANRVVATSSGQGSGRPHSPPQVGAEDDGRPTFEHRYTPSTSVTDTQTLTDHAVRVVTRLAGGTHGLHLAAQGRASGFGRHWKLGDTIGYDVDAPAIGRLIGRARVIGWSWDIAEDIVTPTLDVTQDATPPRFNERLSLHNGTSRRLSRWRGARSTAGTGAGSAHITTFVDSITFGYGTTPPVGVSSWPGQLRALLAARFGYTGTGLIPLLDAGSGQAASEPRVRVIGGTIAHAGGVYNLGAWGIDDTAGAGVEIGPVECTQVTLLHQAQPGLARLYVDGALVGTFANGLGVDAYGASLPIDRVIVRQSGELGLLRTTLTMPSLGVHTVRIAPPVGGHLWPLAIEARYGTTGIRVSNLAQNSMNTEQMAYDDRVLGRTGLGVSVDGAAADLALMMLGTNEFQGHVPVVDFQTRARTIVLRQLERGDVLLIVPPVPDLTRTPPDGVQAPSFEQYRAALYGLADELDVPLLDISHAWGSWAEADARGWVSDRVHLSDAGSAALARVVMTALDTL